MKFAAFFKYAPVPDTITRVRPTHREYIAELKKNNKIAVAGPFTDDSGGLLVYEAETPEEVDAIIRADPFYKEGVFASWTLHPWKVVAFNPVVFPTT